MGVGLGKEDSPEDGRSSSSDVGFCIKEVGSRFDESGD